jgi:hypothetical protein
VPPARQPAPGQRAPASRRRGRVVSVLTVAALVVAALTVVGFKLADDHKGGPPASGANPSASVPLARLPMTPGHVVLAYYSAINHHEYRRAWRLGGRNLGRAYAKFSAGFAGTDHDTVRILSVSGDLVNIRLTATQADGGLKIFQGTYTVRRGHIVRSSINPAS